MYTAGINSVIDTSPHCPRSNIRLTPWAKICHHAQSNEQRAFRVGTHYNQNLREEVSVILVEDVVLRILFIVLDIVVGGGGGGGRVLRCCLLLLAGVATPASSNIGGHYQEL